MVIISLIFLAFIFMNISSNSRRVKKIDAYMKDMEKELSEELKIMK